MSFRYSCVVVRFVRQKFVGNHRKQYTVRSQSGNGVYELMSTEQGWLCSCPDHMYRGVVCKHIHAVEISRRMRDAVQETATPITTIKAMDLTKCKFCDSDHIVKHGTKKLKRGIRPTVPVPNMRQEVHSELGL